MVENGDDKQRIEYAEIRNIIKKIAKEDTRKYNHMRNDHCITEPVGSPKNAEARPRQTDHTPRQAG